MSSGRPRRVAIVDHGLGNLFSVARACEAVGLEPAITSEARVIAGADAVILPGVGAFGDAMDTLRRLDLVSPIHDTVAAGRPMIGICLGVQLLMTESCEFGHHQGLGLISGQVVPLRGRRDDGRPLKVPHVGWSAIHARDGAASEHWSGTPLEGLPSGGLAYFVHSYVVVPEDPEVVLSTTQYGDVEFCSSLRRGSLFACQFHPERSGPDGLRVYANLRRMLEAPAES